MGRMLFRSMCSRLAPCLFLAAPLQAGATTPSVPSVYHHQAAGLSAYHSTIKVSQYMIEDDIEDVEVVDAVYNGIVGAEWNLSVGTLNGPFSSSTIVATMGEEPLNADIRSKRVVYERFGPNIITPPTMSGSDIFLRRYIPLSATGMISTHTGMSTYGRHPRLHGTQVVWHVEEPSGPWYIARRDLVSNSTHLVPSSPTAFYVARPVIWSNYIAYESDWYVEIYNMSTGTYQVFDEPHPNYWDRREPSLGGNRIAYEQIGVDTRISYRNLGTPIGPETAINGPCLHHYDPVVSDTGEFILSRGWGCPDSAAEPLYVTHIDSNGVQSTYFVADMENVELRSEAYDIDNDVIAYLVTPIPLGLSEIWSLKIDRSAL